MLKGSSEIVRILATERQQPWQIDTKPLLGIARHEPADQTSARSGRSPRRPECES